MSEYSPSERFKLSRSIALTAIADVAEKKKEEGASELDIAAFIRGARGKLADDLPDIGKHVKAVTLSNKYQEAKENVHDHAPSRLSNNKEKEIARQNQVQQIAKEKFNNLF